MARRKRRIVRIYHSTTFQARREMLAVFIWGGLDFFAGALQEILLAICIVMQPKRLCSTLTSNTQGTIFIAGLSTFSSHMSLALL